MKKKSLLTKVKTKVSTRTMLLIALGLAIICGAAFGLAPMLQTNTIFNISDSGIKIGSTLLTTVVYSGQGGSANSAVPTICKALKDKGVIKYEVDYDKSVAYSPGQGYCSKRGLAYQAFNPNTKTFFTGYCQSVSIIYIYSRVNCAVKISYPTSIIVPMYIYPGAPEAENPEGINAYNKLIALKQKYPTVDVIAIMNPDSGPGTAVNSDYTDVMSKLKQGGIKMVGYVATTWGGKNINLVKAEIDNWIKLYPGKLNGIFFDEMSADNNIVKITYYAMAANYAKSKGLTFNIGNPGRDVAAGYFTQVPLEAIVVYENPGYPVETLFTNSVNKTVDRTKKSVLVIGQPYNADKITMVKKYVKYIYATNDGLPDINTNNPWDTLPSYLESLFMAAKQS